MIGRGLPFSIPSLDLPLWPLSLTLGQVNRCIDSLIPFSYAVSSFRFWYFRLLSSRYFSFRTVLVLSLPISLFFFISDVNAWVIPRLQSLCHPLSNLRNVGSLARSSSLPFSLHILPHRLLRFLCSRREFNLWSFPVVWHDPRLRGISFFPISGRSCNVSSSVYLKWRREEKKEEMKRIEKLYLNWRGRWRKSMKDSNSSRC